MASPDAAVPSASGEADESVPDGSQTPLLTEFAELWRRGLADVRKLWQLFDACEMYLQRPDYFGAPIFNTGGQLVTPVFSSQKQLAVFMAETEQIDLENAEDSYEWVRLSGEKVFGLPVRARYLYIDPGTAFGTIVDLRSREHPPAIANGAPPIAINLELLPDGSIGGGPANLDLSAPEE